ncbi:acyltransferase family protein [Sphingobacterium sp.]|uniref:acyltransferase family protein n=1 Tax=Sphingobacterium sp. TaxID=341027 RepID=UPI002FD9D1FE
MTTQKYYPGNYANLEVIWYFCNINVAFMTIAIFLVVQKLKIPESKWIKRLSSATFGIYLAHFIPVQALTDIFLPIPHLPATLKIFSIAILGFSLSFLITKLMDSNSITRGFIK